MMGCGINWCPTIDDMDEDNVEQDLYEPTGPDMTEPTG